jgi:multidrug resistance efflux pump
MQKTNSLKFNILYLLFPAALGACIWIARDFEGQSAQSFFGIAETEPYTLNFDHDIAVRELRVKTGDLLKKGDTLAIFERVDLDRAESESRADLVQTNTESAAEYRILEKEKALVTARMQAKLRELQSQMRLLRTEDSLKTAFRKNIYTDLPTPDNQIVTDKIAALRKEMTDVETEAEEELRVLSARQSATREVAAAKSGQAQAELGFVRAERNRLLLVSPIDGYVEGIFFGKNALVPAHRDLLKINPLAPNRIIGFIHEAAEVPFSVGQTVELASFNRPEVTTQGTIVGSNPKMSELPLRLRKLAEVRSWGREVFIQMPEQNAFFISEKINITLGPLTPAQPISAGHDK